MEKYKIKIDDQEYSISQEDLSGLDIIETSMHQYHILEQNTAYRVVLESADFINKKMVLVINGNRYQVAIEDRYDQLIESMGLSAGSAQKIQNVKAPMPGLVLDILVEKEQTVSKGEALLILEAMKMENVLKAEGDGVIKSIEVSKGTAVEKGQIIIEMH